MSRHVEDLVIDHVVTVGHDEMREHGVVFCGGPAAVRLAGDDQLLDADQDQSVADSPALGRRVSRSSSPQKYF